MTEAKYLKIARIIQNRIKDGTYQAQEPLPDQEALAQELGVSRLTVKKALDGLERKGLLYKQSGLGTFVLGDIPIQTDHDTSASVFSGLQEEIGEEKITSDIIKFAIEFPSEQVQKNLRLKSSDPVYEVLRLRRLEANPFVLEHTYMPVKLVPNLDETVLKGSIYHYIHHNLGLKFGTAYRKIRASKATAWDKKYLEAKQDDPILELEQIIWLTNGHPIEYSTSRNRFDTRNYVVFQNKDF
ncbi:GntR family transcriptional regulator [Lactobacillus colini]|uniref:GntR family transcriptional regulator n=1 Tax=Lactobacillus colini TaxID=1819254 RepID=A0ABS4MCE0_9LACO|nr:GntR family transcriptional regulator [Lactobacillus colini]MBP2057355.1 GntR family transcriptional regulator [Lactobacillus colini]